MALEVGDDSLVNDLIMIEDGAVAIELVVDDHIVIDPMIHIDPMPVIEDLATYDLAPIDGFAVITEDVAISEENQAELEGEWSTEFQPKDDAAGEDAGAAAEGELTDIVTTDVVVTDVVVTDGEVAIGDDSLIYTMTGEDMTGEDMTGGDMTGGDLTEEDMIGRPLDPMPNWRTLTGEEGPVDNSADSSADTSADDAPAVIACEDYPVILDETSTTGDDSTTLTYEDDIAIYEKDPAPEGEDGSPSIVYTATDGEIPAEDETSADGEIVIDDGFSFEDFIAIYDKDPAPEGEDGTPLVYATGGPDPRVYAASGTPGRTGDPLPFERTLDTPAVSGPEPQSEPEIDRTPVNYAAADSFHTGLDLL